NRCLIMRMAKQGKQSAAAATVAIVSGWVMNTLKASHDGAVPLFLMLELQECRWLGTLAI
ncbi:MAG: hypothetical protein M3552_17425, partial [Planctomycetota bacterium]|nr:hypothetical protein [Planctomycetota bacterium]